jgi:hypothetical protein
MLATITADPDDGRLVLVRFRYEPAAVGAIKALPSRSWDSRRKVWSVPRDLAPSAGRALKAIGYTVEINVPEPPRGGIGARAAAPSCEALDRLLDALPASNRRKVLRVIAAATHPDAGGDGELSRYVNSMMKST